MKIEESYYKNIRHEMMAFVPESSVRILEVGCASGWFGAALKQRSKAEVWGVELFESAAKEAENRLDKVLVGDFNVKIAELPKDYFDCVVFNDVLEHFTNPDEVLIRLKNVMSEDGVVVASIPNVRYIGNLKNMLLHKDWEYIDSGILDKTHYRFFTEKSIIRMFEKSGYDVVEIKGINGVKTILTNLLVFFTLGFYKDVKYLEFAVVAKLKK